MKVTKNWIYRYNEWCNDKPFTIDNVNDEKIICSCFWKSMWNIVGVNILHIIIFMSFGLAVGSWSVDTIMAFVGNTTVSLVFAAIVGWAILFLLIAIVISLAWILHEVRSKCLKSRAEKVEIEVDTQSSLIVEFFKAKKAKFCPMIEWVDAEEDKKEKEKK